jgi:hypothetical protein
MTDENRLDRYERALQEIVEMADAFPAEPFNIREAAQLLGEALRRQQGINHQSPFDPVAFMNRIVATMGHIARLALK